MVSMEEDIEVREDSSLRAKLVKDVLEYYLLKHAFSYTDDFINGINEHMCKYLSFKMLFSDLNIDENNNTTGSISFTEDDGTVKVVDFLIGKKV